MLENCLLIYKNIIERCVWFSSVHFRDSGIWPGLHVLALHLFACATICIIWLHLTNKDAWLFCFNWDIHPLNVCGVGLQVAWPQHIPKPFTSWIYRPLTGLSHPSLSSSTLWRSLHGRMPRKRPAAWRRSEISPLCSQKKKIHHNYKNILGSVQVMLNQQHLWVSHLFFKSQNIRYTEVHQSIHFKILAISIVSPQDINNNFNMILMLCKVISHFTGLSAWKQITVNPKPFSCSAKFRGWFSVISIGIYTRLGILPKAKHFSKADIQVFHAELPCWPTESQ